MRYGIVGIVLLAFSLVSGQAEAAISRSCNAAKLHAQACHRLRAGAHHRTRRGPAGHRKRVLPAQKFGGDHKGPAITLFDRVDPARRLTLDRQLDGGGRASVGLVQGVRGPVIDPHSLGAAAASQPNPAGSVAGAQVHIPF